QAEDGIRAGHVTGVQTCALPILCGRNRWPYNRQLPTLHSSRGDYLVCTTPRLLSRSAHGRGSHITRMDTRVYTAAFAIVVFASRSEERRVGNWLCLSVSASDERK